MRHVVLRLAGFLLMVLAAESRLVAQDEQHDVELAALHVLARFDDPDVPARILDEYPRLDDGVKQQCRQVLFGRKPWALAFLDRVDQKQLSPQLVSVEELRRLKGFSDEQVDKLILKHWGQLGPETPEEKLAEIRRLSQALGERGGDPKAGKALFQEHCAKCHRIFGEGETIGPDLMAINRKDRQYVLTSVVDPSTYIRAEFLPVQVVTANGLILQGLILEQNDREVTLVDAKAEKSKIARSDIDEIVASQISQMPEDLLKPLSLEQVRDLFAYLESDADSAKGGNRSSAKPVPL